MNKKYIVSNVAKVHRPRLLALSSRRCFYTIRYKSANFNPKTAPTKVQTKLSDP